MKRYAQYKESGIEWIGNIPSTWKICKLKYFSSMKSGNSIISEDINEVGNFPVYGGNGLRGYTSSFTNNGDYILIGRQGALCGNVRLVKGQFWATEHAVVVYENECVSKHWYRYLLDFMNLNQYSTSAAQPGLSVEQIMNLFACFPSNGEQKAIANYLDRKTASIDTLIADKQKLIDLLREKRQAIISEAVTKGLDKSAKMKDSGIEWIGKIPEDWKVSRIGYETWVRARLGWKGLKAEEYVDEGYAFLSTPNIKGREIDFENVNYISKERFDESPEIKLNIGDILLAKDGSTLGTINVVRHLPKETTVNSSIAVITPNESMGSVFLYYLFQSEYMNNIIQMKKGGMGVPHLFQGDIVKFCIPVPPKNEQILIAKYLDAKTIQIDFLISDISEQIEKLKEYRQSIISEVVTGKVAV